ncbi:flippase-like domain-containing protein [bacterium]|nr:flippase-like domain-containing protein [bacterium]
MIIWSPQPLGFFRGDISLIDAFFGKMRLDFGRLSQIILGVNPVYLILAFLITPIHVAVRSHRWIIIVKPLGRLSFLNSFSIQMVSYMANSVLPLRIGEIAKGVLLGRRLKIPASTGFGTVVLERAFDSLFLALMIIIIGLIYQFPQEIKSPAQILSLVIFLGMVALIYLALATESDGGIVGKLIRMIPGKPGDQVYKIAISFTTGFAGIKSPAGYMAISIESILLWILYAAQVLAMMMAFRFHIDYPQIAASPVLVTFLLLVVTAVGLSVPSAPGGIGTFHATCVFGLSLFGVNADAAAGFALLIHAISIIYYIFGGIPFMWREGLHWSQLRKMKVDDE